jgi:hypothetical protein
MQSLGGAEREHNMRRLLEEIMKGQGAGFGRQGFGGRDFCYCPTCKEKVPHERGTPCVNQKCPKCGGALVPAEE